MELLVLNMGTIPTNIIFDHAKKRTTLLFPSQTLDKLYDSYSATCDEKDLFSLKTGFEIALYKYRYERLGKEKLRKRIDTIYKYGFEFETPNYLLDSGLSGKQILKLYSSLGSKNSLITLRIVDEDYTIKIEHKGRNKKWKK